MRLQIAAIVLSALTLLSCGGSSTVIGPGANTLQYAAPVPYALPPGHNQPSFYNSLGHALTYAAVLPSGQQMAFWTSPADVQFIGPNEYEINPASLNDHDEIVGNSRGDIPLARHAFYYRVSDSSYIHLKEPAGIVQSFASCINEHGQIIGFGRDNNSVPHDLYWANKNADPVEFNVGHAVIPIHIDNAGRIVGFDFNTPDVTTIQASYSSSLTLMTGPGSSLYASIRGFTPKGVAAGCYGVSSSFPVAGFWLQGDSIATPMSPVVGYAFATVTSVTDTGFATGYFGNSHGTNSAFVYSGDTAVDLKNVTPNQDGWDFVTGIWVDAQGNLTVQGWKAGDFILLYLKRQK